MITPLRPSATGDGTDLLARAIEELAGADTIDAVAAVVRRAARALAAADGATFVLREDDLCVYVDEDAIGPLWKGQSFALDACVSGWSMLHRETAIVPDILTDTRVPQAAYAPTFVRAMATVPVRTEDPIGTIGLYWRTVHQPSPDAIAAVETLARATATAIRNIRLVAQLQRALADAELARDELRHRVKNAYTTAIAVARLSLPLEHGEKVAERLAVIARTQSLLDTDAPRSDLATVGGLVAAELAPFDGFGERRIWTEGPPVSIAGERAVALGLMLHELTTNALKYGALSQAAGRVAVTWQVTDGTLRLEWLERGGPPVPDDAVEGEGSALLRRLARAAKGTIDRAFERNGVAAVITMPLTADRTAP